MTVKTSKAAGTPASKPYNQNQLVFFGIIGTAVVLALVFILASGTGGSSLDKSVFASITQSRTADGAFVLGSPDAPITLVEFMDFACSHCIEYKPTIDEFITRFVATGKAKYELRVLPTAGGEITAYAYQLAECAEQQRQGAFWEAYVMLFDLGTRGGYNMGMARTFEERLGLNLNQLLNCQSTATQLSTDRQLATALRVTGTPKVFVRYGDSNPQEINVTDINGLTTLVEAMQ